MQYRKLGSSELNVPIVSFGAWAIGGWMWGGTDDAAAADAIRRAIDEGMTLIDTAPTYGMGHSERIVGEAIRGRRDEVIVATKCGVRWNLDTDREGMITKTNEGKTVKLVRCLSKESVRHEVDQSLLRLDIDVIDLYQCHWPDPMTQIEETMEALLEAQTAGKIRHIGVSNFTVDMMQSCLKHGAIVSDQPRYNALQREIESDVLPFCRDHDIGILAYSPIAQGLLTGKVGPDRQFSEGDGRTARPWFQPANRARVLDMLEHVGPIAKAHSATLGQVFINWLIHEPGVTTALVGARTPEQVTENAKAGSFTLTPDEQKKIRNLVEALGDPV